MYQYMCLKALICDDSKEIMDAKSVSEERLSEANVPTRNSVNFVSSGT